MGASIGHQIQYWLSRKSSVNKNGQLEQLLQEKRLLKREVLYKSAAPLLPNSLEREKMYVEYSLPVGIQLFSISRHR